MFRLPNMKVFKPHYDKILHVICTFFAVVWMARFGCPNSLIVIFVFNLQIVKTILNRTSDPSYKPYGDWGGEYYWLDHIGDVSLDMNGFMWGLPLKRRRQ